VLAMLCTMYLSTHIDRVNVSTATVAFKQELRLSNMSFRMHPERPLDDAKA
jgi:hypothetical protein